MEYFKVLQLPRITFILFYSDSSCEISTCSKTYRRKITVKHFTGSGLKNWMIVSLSYEIVVNSNCSKPLRE